MAAKADKRRITRTVSSLQNESDEALLSKVSLSLSLSLLARSLARARALSL